MHEKLTASGALYVSRGKSSEWPVEAGNIINHSSCQKGKENSSIVGGACSLAKKSGEVLSTRERGAEDLSAQNLDRENEKGSLLQGETIGRLAKTKKRRGSKLAAVPG